MSDRTKAYVDTHALHYNLALIRKIAPHSRVLVMVKSNAYGHGLVPITSALKNVDGFGVACLDEAVILREAGVVAPVVIMSGVYTLDDVLQVEHYNLQVVVHEQAQVELIQAAPVKQPITAWLKIDTGMHRLGFPPAQFCAVYAALQHCPNIAAPITVMTHLADADNVHKQTTLNQLAVFEHCTNGLTCPKSIANSAGILAWPETIAQWNRAGIMLYGISPILGRLGADHGLRSVMTLKSKVVAIHTLNQGDSIGYGGTWTCPEDMRVATVAIGYGDGYPRHAQNGTPTLIKGKVCPLAGRVSMDLITVDLRSCPEARLGDDVVLWGEGLPAETVATYANTIAYQLMCNLSQRVVFVYQ